MKEFRGGIIRMFEQGKSGYKIAQDMNLHARTVNRIIKRYQEKQEATATDKEAKYQEFTRFERDGLLNLEHLGGGSMLEAPPVD
uniref:Transposase n=1 Tax=Acrobeloides nanus TaxID=290746 RepID=A0A914CPR4_9BILA